MEEQLRYLVALQRLAILLAVPQHSEVELVTEQAPVVPWLLLVELPAQEPQGTVVLLR